MNQDTFKYIRALVVILLLAVIVTGGLAAWSKYDPEQPLEITLKPAAEIAGEIYAGGGVNNPGFYPFTASDTLPDIIRAAGGLAADAAPGQLRLDVPRNAADPPQKIDLNRAEAWLLEALPGIGETRARAIIDYRTQHGRFRNVAELQQVEGIGAATYETIKDLVTVAE
ncbi:MAG: ComEA family DNA-binding protein [Dehalococcoidales bacterium]|nr:ComEA family DNA-binding protein [Dehalococcoidales bacterium]